VHGVIDGRNRFFKSSPALLLQRREQYFPLWKRGIEGDFPLYALVLFLRRRPPGRRGWS
jgi:hypothetical protein